MHPRTTTAALVVGLLLTGCADGSNSTAETTGNTTGASATTPAASDAPEVVTSGTVTELATTPEPQPTATAAVTPASTPAEGERFPDVLDATITADGDGTFTVAATISSPYDHPDRYADAFRVLAPDGTELAVRELTHDHADEQPFTRSVDGVEIPADVGEIQVQGRDQASGYGGATVVVSVPRG